MFTGLVQALGTVRSVSLAGTGRRLWIDAPFGSMGLGESVACDGVCLTVDEILGGAFQVTAGEETLRRTTLSDFSTGHPINLERALLATDRIGGHFVTGHVDGIAVVKRLSRRPGFLEVEIEPPFALMRYFVEKGSITLSGVSLTVNETGPATVVVGIIPHTAAVTGFRSIQVGDRLNVEVDVLARYVFQALSPQFGPGAERATEDNRLARLLSERGFTKEGT